MEYVNILVHIFLNAQSILKILGSKRGPTEAQTQRTNSCSKIVPAPVHPPTPTEAQYYSSFTMSQISLSLSPSLALPHKHTLSHTRSLYLSVFFSLCLSLCLSVSGSISLALFLPFSLSHSITHTHISHVLR